MSPAPEIRPEPSALPFAEYAFLRDEIRHEDNLLNQRLSWLVSSQSFLLTGFAIAVDGPVASKFPRYTELNRALVTWLPIAGILTGLVCYLPILGGILHMKRIRGLAGTSHPAHLPAVQGSALTRSLGLSGPLAIPLIFLTVWTAIVLRR